MAVLGPSRVVNVFVEGVVGKLPSKLSMPWSGDRRDRFRELSELTRQHGFVAGYAYGSSGLNIFGVEQDSLFRFVRSLIVLGNPVPNLGDVAATHHGLYSDLYNLVPVQAEGFDFSEQVPAVVDWSIVQRDVAFCGTQREDRVLVRRNVIGFADERANSILRGLYESELIQMLAECVRSSPIRLIQPLTSRFCYRRNAVARHSDAQGDWARRITEVAGAGVQS